MRSSTRRSSVRRFAARRRRIGRALILAGLALFVGGFAGFGVYGDRTDALQKNGVKTTATVTDTALYGGPRGPNEFTEHIDVSFTAPSGLVQGVRIPIGEDDRFSVGQQVEISYDPANPHRAVFAHGYADIGQMGFVFFFATAAGVGVLIYGVGTLRLARGARRALGGPSRSMTVESRLAVAGSTLAAPPSSSATSGEPSALWATGSDWSLPRTSQGDRVRDGNARVGGSRRRPGGRRRHRRADLEASPHLTAAASYKRAAASSASAISARSCSSANGSSTRPFATRAP